jgi:hypothetical protein
MLPDDEFRPPDKRLNPANKELFQKQFLLSKSLR